MIRHRLLTALLCCVLTLTTYAAGPTLTPDVVFRDSSLTGWTPLGQADWRAQNGEIVGTLSQSQAANAKFVPIFNGKDLTGWHIDHVPADAALASKLFTIQNGELTLDTPGTADYAWLTFDKELTDFALRLEFVAYQDARGNCGIQFRDKWVNNKYPRHGFDLASNVPESTGFIWDFEESWLPFPMKGYRSDNFKPYLPEGWTYKWSTDPDPWNQFEVSVVASRVRTVLNGREIINWDGGAKIKPTGNIAIEVHGKQVFRFKFRNIQLAEL